MAGCACLALIVCFRFAVLEKLKMPNALSDGKCISLLGRYKTPKEIASHCEAASRKALQILDGI